jgi:hypothetical protein
MGLIANYEEKEDAGTLLNIRGSKHVSDGIYMHPLDQQASYALQQVCIGENDSFRFLKQPL